MAHFKRLVRFEDSEGTVHYGEVPQGQSWEQSLVGVTVHIYEGGEPWEDGFVLTKQTATITKVLSPVESPPLVIGIGLNYRQHAEEAKVASFPCQTRVQVDSRNIQFPLPPHPLVFIKGTGPHSVTGAYDNVPIPQEAKLLDYEGELTIVFGKAAKDVTEAENAYDYLLGYTVGNDVSSRYWQDPTRAGGQHGYAKAFDRFAPIGPILASTLQIPDPSELTLKTTVNGEQRQLTKTDDLIFDIPAIVRHLTRGRTVYPGTVVMTGTPSGVAAFMKPQAWLQDGDIVEVEISGIGSLKNKMSFV